MCGGRGGGVDRGAVDRRTYGAARVMGQDDDQRHLEDGDRVFQACDDRLAHDLAGVADDEEIAQTQVEDDLGGEAGVGAAEQRRDRMLRGGEILAPQHVLVRVARLVGDESAVSVQHLLPGRGRGQGVRHEVSERARICGMRDSASSAVESADREP